MQRYFINTKLDEDGLFLVEGEDYKHIVRVMRMSEGDRFIAVFNTDEVFESEIVKIEETHLVGKKVSEITNQSELPVNVTIAHGLPKGDKLEYVIQKATELGMSALIPFSAERSIVKWDQKKGKKKAERWNKIAKEAAEQSHRSVIPLIEEPFTLKQLRSSFHEYDAIMMAYEEDAKSGESSNFHRFLNQLKPDSNILVIIGPEGGLSENEVKQFIEDGAVSCGLGPRILRTETAPLYILAAFSYHFELMR
ncbi:16S rRNA (uracil(1498)-N(3))-methyltransferase [Jeotgalibacillus haloalkalitolerans]|uniref:Ribosomal RNA small subunit methyltransferase E n=1 Tax=Jeotgalibacillus haloalkalitolerans TaxID=3104292 RepID=A0ABU5KLW8_9BACL|nr:16S rRNA (uracil(1498)-N(3))-methyltransferase [Jeotgalibacillus sp. HH7-29]MDZ5712218.1 16S rRNA (uracil(1498)-N(3))-methyltransferase [Jeotgalibacillus sp. HH7-29]